MHLVEFLPFLFMAREIHFCLPVCFTVHEVSSVLKRNDFSPFWSRPVFRKEANNFDRDIESVSIIL